MKKLLLSATALFALTAGAGAADLPIRSAPPAPIIAAVPVFTWTGFYVGVNAGYGWDSNSNKTVFYPATGVILSGQWRQQWRLRRRWPDRLQLPDRLLRDRRRDRHPVRRHQSRSQPPRREFEP